MGATDYTDHITLYALWTKTIGENGSYTVDEIPAQTYTGAEIKPAVVVRNSTTGDVIASSQYSVSYSDNTNVGTAKATITVGSDKAEVEFKIVKDENPAVEMTDVSVTYGDSYAMTATAKTSAGNKIEDGTITIKYYTDEDCTKGETSTAPTNAGVYYAKATLSGTDNYAQATNTVKIEISNADFSVTAEGYDGVYDGQTHSITVTADDGVTVTYSTDGTNYSVTNPAYTDAGEHTIYYKAVKANHNDVTGSVAVKIAKATLTAPVLTSYTATTASISVAEPTLPDGASKVQYSIDNGANWQDSNVFSGLTSGTSYSVIARFVADDSGNYADSADSTALSVRTNSVGTSHYPTVQKPVIETSEGVTATLGSTGTTATITVVDGYELTDVTVNGVSKGAVTTLTGLKTGDKVVITAQKITSADDNAALIEAVKNTRLVARSMYAKAPSGKKSIKVYWFNRDGSELNFDGYEVYRSLKKDSGYGTKPIFKTTKARYYNTAIKKGTKYYYKVRAYKVINGEKVYTQYSLKAWRTAK